MSRLRLTISSCLAHSSHGVWSSEFWHRHPSLSPFHSPLGPSGTCPWSQLPIHSDDTPAKPLSSTPDSHPQQHWPSPPQIYLSEGAPPILPDLRLPGLPFQRAWKLKPGAQESPWPPHSLLPFQVRPVDAVRYNVLTASLAFLPPVGASPASLLHTPVGITSGHGKSSSWPGDASKATPGHGAQPPLLPGGEALGLVLPLPGPAFCNLLLLLPAVLPLQTALGDPAVWPGASGPCSVSDLRLTCTPIFVSLETIRF